MTAPDAPLLTPLEARILGSLMEKQRATPEQYPLTLNSLVTACNQKTARDPVLKLTSGEVGHAVAVLRDRGLVHESFSGRTERYDHKLAGTFMLDRREQALLAVLMLRGPQTPGELRTNAARLADFDALGSVNGTLVALAGREPSLVRELPRQPGMREQRWAHLLCGEPDLHQFAALAGSGASVGPGVGPGAGRVAGAEPASPAADAALLARVEALEAEVAALREAVATLAAGR